MSKASELMERVLHRMEDRNIVAYYQNGIHINWVKGEKPPEKHLNVSETYKHNATEENVTVTIEGSVRISEYSSRRTLKVRVPKDASDRVIDRRLDEVERWLGE